jgi:hypothetical protein
MPSEAKLISAMTLKGHSEETAKATIAGRSGESLQNLYREYLGSAPANGQPQTPQEVTPYLNTYQQNLLGQSTDPALQSLISTYAPALGTGITPAAGLGYVPQEGLAGKSLKQIRDERNLAFRPDVLANFLGIDENQPLTAEQTVGLGSLDLSDTGSAEVKAFGQIFTRQQPSPTETTTLTGVPQPISRVEEFERLRAEYGVADMESYLVDLKAQEEFLYAELRARTGAERGKPVPMGVIAGRIGEVERQQMERIDVIRRLKATVTDQLNVAYGVISTYINYMGQDYNDAVNAYNDAFKRNVTIYGLMADVRKEQREEVRYQQQIASANLQTMVNAITAGNISYGDLPVDQQSMIRKLEVQAGLPAGFTENIKMSKGDSMLFSTSNEGITQIGFLQPDGTVKVEEYGRRIKGTGNGKLTELDYKDYLVEDIRNYANLDSVMSFYGTYLDPKEILGIYDRNSPFGSHKESDDELQQKYGIRF